MPKIICTAPKANTTIEQSRASEAAFLSIYAEHFGAGARPSVWWMLTPAGQTFQAGQPADVYIAMIEVDNGLPQDRREPAIWAFTNAWAQILGVGVDRLMVTCADTDTVDAYMRGNRNRLRPLSRPWFMVTTVLHMLRSRRRDGVAALRANL